MNRCRHIFFVMATLFMAAPLKQHAQSLNYKAYSLYVYNFMKYIEWPDSYGKNDFIIGVLGDSPVLKELETMATLKKINGRKIVVKKFSTPEECADCHLLYVSSSRASSIKLLRESFRDKATLIVGEREGLARKGAAMSFVTLEDDLLKFDINKTEIERHNLKISIALVTLGIVVG